MQTEHTASPTISLFIMLAVGLVAGVGTAALVEGQGLGARGVALASGVVAVTVASVLRFKMASSLSPRGAAEGSLIGAMLVYGLISTVAGSLAGHDVYGWLDMRMPLMLGAISGLLSVSVMSVAMVTFHEHRRPVPEADAAALAGSQPSKA